MTSIEITAKMEALKKELTSKYWGKQVLKSQAIADLMQWKILEKQLELAKNAWTAEFSVLVNRRTGQEVVASLKYDERGSYWVIKTVSGYETHRNMHGKNTSLYNAGYEMRKVKKSAVAVLRMDENGKQYVEVVRAN